MTLSDKIMLLFDKRPVSDISRVIEDLYIIYGTRHDKLIIYRKLINLVIAGELCYRDGKYRKE